MSQSECCSLPLFFSLCECFSFVHIVGDRVACLAGMFIEGCVKFLQVLHKYARIDFVVVALSHSHSPSLAR